MYKSPTIKSGAGIIAELANLSGHVAVVTMDIPWAVLQEQFSWQPNVVHMVQSMDLSVVEELESTLPACDVIIGVGGGSCCDTAKYIAWKRGCRMVLVPSIVSVDAPLTNMIAVRVDKTVKYIGDIFPEELLIDYDLIRQAPVALNRAGACDIASIHTALYDWKLAHENIREPYHPEVAKLAKECLLELDRNAGEIFNVSPKGIDTIVDLFRREVKFCSEIGTSRPEEGAEHIVAYNIEHLTRRHFVHGDLVGFGIYVISRLQGNRSDWATDLIGRCGLRYNVPDTDRNELANSIRTLKEFKDQAGLFYSIVDTIEITDDFVEEVISSLPPVKPE